MKKKTSNLPADMPISFYLKILLISIIILVILFKGASLLLNKMDNSIIEDSSSNYSEYHRCEYPGCDNYASRTKYCSKHTSLKRCSKPGCTNQVSYEGAKYCKKHSIEEYHKV